VKTQVITKLFIGGNRSILSSIYVIGFCDYIQEKLFIFKPIRPRGCFVGVCLIVMVWFRSKKKKKPIQYFSFL